MTDRNLMRTKITVVEDDPDILFALTTILSNAGYEVSALNSGHVIMHGKHDYPDLFILDKRMPDMDGLDICRFLKGNAASRDIPIIIISASPKFDVLARQAGANGFLSKPFTMNALLDTVARHLQ
jgi:DNA-binding response OmpR family regulator